MGPSSPGKCPTSQEVVQSSPKCEHTDQETLSLSEPTDQEIVSSPSEGKPTDEKIVLSSDPTHVKIVPSSPEKDPTDEETSLSSPKRVPTCKNPIISFSPKRKCTDKKRILKPVLQERTLSLPKREPNDQDVFSSSHKKATDSLCSPEQKPPSKKRAPSSIKQMPPDNKNGRFSYDPDEESRSPFLLNSGLTGRKTIPFMVLI